MAPPATEPGTSRWLKELAWYPGRTSYSARIALICLLTLLVTEIYQTPEAALTTYVVFFLKGKDRTSSIAGSVVMLLLITFVIGLVLSVTQLVIDAPMGRVASIAVLSLGLLFATSASKLKPVGAIVALVVGYALDLLGDVHSGELATRALLYAWLFAGIPVAVSVATNLVLAPAPRRLAEGALAERVRLAAAALRSPETSRQRLADVLREGDGEIVRWLKLAGVEHATAKTDIDALGRATRATNAILLLASAAWDESEARLPEPVAALFGQTLTEIADMLELGHYPLGISLEYPRAELTLAADALADALRKQIVTFAEATGETTGANATPAKTHGFWLPDAFDNPDHLRYALKTTMAAMLCYLAYQLMDWPGIHTCFITCYIVSLDTAAETVEKLTLRIIGCLIGAALGVSAMIYAVPAMDSIGPFMALVFLGAWGSAWIAVGGPRSAYAGFQIAFAFFLCVIQGSGPGFDMVVARDRIFGILLGNLVVYLIFTRLWPVSLSQRIDPALARLLRQLAELAQAVRPNAPALANGLPAQRGEIARNLANLRFEPAWVRPDDAWLESRNRAVATIETLEGKLLLLAEGFGGDTHVANRLNHLADRLRSGDVGAPPAVRSTVDTELRHLNSRPQILAKIDRYLSDLEQSFDQSGHDGEWAHVST